MPLRIYLTGRVCIEADGALLEERRFPGRQGRLVFALLAGEHRRPVAREELVTELWGDAPPPSEERALNALLSKLRALLARGDVGGVSLTGGFGGYQLALPADAWIDLEAAGEGLDQAEGALREGDPRRAWAGAEVAYQVARRPFLPGDEGPWAAQTRAELRDTLLRALECLSAIYIWNGEPALAVRHAEHALRLDPFRETGYQQLMRVHAAAGNRAQALRVYEECRRLLAEELGVPPSPATEAVYLEIVRA